MQKKTINAFYEKIFPLLLLFIGIFVAFLINEHYKRIVRHIITISSNHKIHFTGDNNHIFPSTLFLFSFGWLLSLSYITIKTLLTNKFQKTVSALVIFILSMIIVIYIDSKRLLMECTMCVDGIRKIQYNDISYNSYFIISSVATFIYFAVSFILEIRKLNKKEIV